MVFGLFDKKDKELTDNTPASESLLSGESTVNEWLEHPVGGVIFREMLSKAGQNESVLRPVKRMKLQKLVSMSRGQFTEEMMNDMVVRANSSSVGVGSFSDPEISSKEPTKVKISKISEWQEKITKARFDSKTVIVTGAGSGIGRATAVRVAKEGGHVVAVDISQERLDELKKEFTDLNIVIVKGDITKDEDIKLIISSTDGKVDALANIAGIMDNMTPLHEVSDEIWERVMNVNVNGMMRLTRAVLPFMIEKNKGSIVNIGSEASLRGSVAGAAYTTSKHAVVGLTKSSAFMYGAKGIRVNMVAPGATLTNIQASFDSELGSERVNNVLSIMPDTATSEELASSICYLLSDDSVNINGAILASDNGWSVQ
jgi:NAD(P)-dependent dehydrogenase (short-subunit alcohol dehydrogenase family)